jgi:hypothetical protein
LVIDRFDCLQLGRADTIDKSRGPSPIPMTTNQEEGDSLGADVVAGCLAAIALVAAVVFFPAWSLFIVFLVALWYTYFSDTFDRDEDLATGCTALLWGAGVLALETLHWFFGQMFEIADRVSLRDVLIPTTGLPIEYLYSLFAWGALFVALLCFLRVAWDAVTN